MTSERLFLLDRVRERDLDVLLAAHLSASEAFRALVVHHASGTVAPHTVLSCQVSASTDAGETDLLLVLQLMPEEGGRLAYMLEDKIDAAFQPEQAARYRQRGKQGIQDRKWDDFRTCLVAPAAYINQIPHRGEWDGYLSLEQIAEWAWAVGGPHEIFLARVCAEAVAKQAIGVSEVSPEATAFWRAYRDAAMELLPELKISRLPLTVGRASPWPRFGVGLLPTGVLLEHKPQQGRIDLTVQGQSAEQLRAATYGELPLGILVVPAGRSAALRFAVPAVDHLRPFAEQEAEVLAALAAVENLYAVGRSLPSNALLPS